MSARPVVAGVDGSEESLRAVEWAAREAVRRGAPLRIVSAPAALPRIRAYQVSRQSVSNALHGMSARALGAAITRAEEVAPGLAIDTRMLTGLTAVAVTDTGADALMLVVGARGAGGFAAMLLGSVSRYAAANAICPVVVVREQTVAVHAAVVVGIHDPRDAGDALAFAFEEAAVRGAELVAVHVVSLPSHDGRGSTAEERDAEAERIWQALADGEQDLEDTLHGWRGKYPGVVTRKDVVRGNPAQVLAAYCARADLVVVGRRETPGPGEARRDIGATRHALLAHAHGPVVVVPHTPASA